MILHFKDLSLNCSNFHPLNPSKKPFAKLVNNQLGIANIQRSMKALAGTTSSSENNTNKQTKVAGRLGSNRQHMSPQVVTKASSVFYQRLVKHPKIIRSNGIENRKCICYLEKTKSRLESCDVTRCHACTMRLCVPTACMKSGRMWPQTAG